MNTDNVAYAYVKALRAIVDSVSTKDEADRTLNAMQKDQGAQELLKALTGYDKLK